MLEMLLKPIMSNNNDAQFIIKPEKWRSKSLARNYNESDRENTFANDHRKSKTRNKPLPSKSSSTTRRRKSKRKSSHSHKKDHQRPLSSLSHKKYSHHHHKNHKKSRKKSKKRNQLQTIASSTSEEDQSRSNKQTIDDDDDDDKYYNQCIIPEIDFGQSSKFLQFPPEEGEEEEEMMKKKEQEEEAGSAQSNECIQSSESEETSPITSSSDTSSTIMSSSDQSIQPVHQSFFPSGRSYPALSTILCDNCKNILSEAISDDSVSYIANQKATTTDNDIFTNFSDGDIQPEDDFLLTAKNKKLILTDPKEDKMKKEKETAPPKIVQLPPSPPPPPPPPPPQYSQKRIRSRFFHINELVGFKRLLPTEKVHIFTQPEIDLQCAACLYETNRIKKKHLCPEFEKEILEILNHEYPEW